MNQPEKQNSGLSRRDLLRKHGGKHGTIHSAIGGGDVDPVTLSGKGMYLV